MNSMSDVKKRESLLWEMAKLYDMTPEEYLKMKSGEY